MGVKSFYKHLISRDNYDEVMEYLKVAEPRYAPQFDDESVQKEVKELLEVAKKPRSKERSEWLNECARRSWAVPDGECSFLFAEDHLNSIRHLNQYLRKANRKLVQDGIFACAFDTAQKRKAQIFDRYPHFIASIVYFFDFIWHRIFPKMRITRRFYYMCTRRVRKVFPRPEVLGRLYYCGFEVLSEQYIHDRYCVIATKKRPPFTETHHYGLIVKLKRVGKNKQLFNVYKFRTMYAYAEFLQNYVYENNDLDEGGKFKDDYRITEWGRVLRKLWIDELPMFVNILKGQMKLVGVRPLSQQYFNLYSTELQELRTKTKPGLLPPYYVDMPETLDEIQESERRYLEAYFKHPMKTDWKYFWAIIRNIVFKGERSK